MAASVFDSPLFARLFDTGDAGRLFSDSAAIRAMLLVEGALAQVQGKLGIIPEVSAAAIHRATMEIQLDPGALARATGDNGVSLPGLVAAFRAEMQAPEHAQYIHWGATSQDIIDTSLMLRMRQALTLAEADLKEVIQTLGTHAQTHASLQMCARTYGQHATPTTFGAICAEWGVPLLDAYHALAALRENALYVSLSGAAGTAQALGPKAAQTRADLATALGLHDPERSWHVDRGPLLRIADWQGQVVAALAHMAQSLMALSSSDVGEVSLGAAGASSTMPQKKNPVGPSAVLACSYAHTGLRSTLQTASVHAHQRDAAAWFAEWMVVPQMTLGLASALRHATAITTGMTPQHVRMRANMQGSLGLIHAEALSFALATRMSRPDAQGATKTLCARALEEQVPLADVAVAAYPDLDARVFGGDTGQACTDALAFAARAQAL